MILISHRGNINGKNKERENEPLYIIEATEKGYDVEIDVWWKEDRFYLGHDEPYYKVNINFLQNRKFWCHAKNIEALYRLQEMNAHCFWHQRDAVTLTTEGYLWTYPLEELTPNSICVMPELQAIEVKGCAGVCSDYIKMYEDLDDTK
jgi:hypothetical protein